MIFSHTQISQYLRCPRSYRYRYLDGWQEKETRAAMVFGRCFEKALGAYFRRGSHRGAVQGMGRVSRCSVRIQERRILGPFGPPGSSFTPEIRSGRSRSHLSTPKEPASQADPNAAGDNEFVAYIDALGELDGSAASLTGKRPTSRYPEEPEGLLALDPQLICYSWISGIPDVALVVFVRKNHPEIQYLRATISEEQRQEYGRLVETTVAQIEAGQFPPHSGIRFPQNGCVSCPHLGLCLNNQRLIDANLIRRAGASRP